MIVTVVVQWQSIGRPNLEVVGSNPTKINFFLTVGSPKFPLTKGHYVSVKSKLQQPLQSYPGHLMPFPAREGGNLMNLVFPGAGHLITTHRGYGI